MKRLIVTTLLIMTGLGMIIYPQISKRLYDQQMSSQTMEYENKVKQIESDRIDEEWEKAIVYNENLIGEPVRDPFVEGSGRAMPKNYTEVLSFPDKSMGSLEIPKISVRLPIYHGTSESVLQKGIGHMEGTSLPVGGEGSHAVLTGHTGLAHSKMLTDLTELEQGDLFFINVLDKILAYKVNQIKVVLPNDLENINLEKGEDYVTLLTCTPFGVNSHRLLVRGERTEYRPEEKEKIHPIKMVSEADKRLLKAIIITASIMLLLIVMTIIVSKRRKRTVDNKGKSKRKRKKRK